MLISHTYRFVFIKTRKVAGTSLERYIVDNHFSEKDDIVTGSIVDNLPWINCPQATKGHMPYPMIINSFGSQLREYRWFTIERNPWDKCVSNYYFLKKYTDQLAHIDTFKDYLLKAYESLPVDRQKYLGCDCTVVKFEQMEDGMSDVFSLLGLEFDFPKFEKYSYKKGARKDVHYSAEYDDIGIKIVGALFDWEIKNFNYKFEDRR